MFRNREQLLIDFVTRVDRGHETAVALVQGLRARTDLTTLLTSWVRIDIDSNEMLSPRTSQERRLREFARHLPGGLPLHALPAYTRPPAGAKYAHSTDEFVAPNFQAFFAADAQAGAMLDQVFENPNTIVLSDRELIELFQRGVRRSAHSPNLMFGWISGSLGWPRDPLLTEIFYQTMDPKAPPEIRQAGIYFGLGLGTSKTKNILEAMCRAYVAPPFDRTTSGNMRSRILWGVRDHEDDKRYLAKRFEKVLRDHAALSDEALRQADIAYRQLTDEPPPNASQYASRSVYLEMFRDPYAQSIEESEKRLRNRFDDSQHLLEMKFLDDGEITVIAAVQGMAGMKWLVDGLQTKPKLPGDFADLLTRELIDQADNDVLRDFEKHLPALQR